MLPKTYRLSRPDILKLRAHGHRLQGNSFSLIYGPNPVSHLRLSIEVSLRVDKRATFRNHLRRLIFVAAQHSPILKKPLDVLVVIKSSAAKVYDISIIIHEIETLR